MRVKIFNFFGGWGAQSLSFGEVGKLSLSEGMTLKEKKSKTSIFDKKSNVFTKNKHLSAQRKKYEVLNEKPNTALQ